MGHLNFLLLAVLFCVFHSVIGQILVATPSNTEECIPVLIVWTGGTAPYSIEILEGGSSPFTLANNVQGTAFTWEVDFPSGTALSIQVTDSTGLIGTTGSFPVLASSDTSCVSGSSGTSTKEPTTSTVPTTAPITTPSKSSAPPASSSAAASSKSVPPASESSGTSSSSNSPSGTSSSSNFASSVSSSASSSPSSSASSTPPTVSRHENHVGAIAGGVVGGVVANCLAVFVWWYFRGRGTQRQVSPANTVEKAAPAPTALTGTPALHTYEQEQDFQPWELSSDGYGAATAVPVAEVVHPSPVQADPIKNPIILRWDPLTAASSDAVPGSSRERELEDRVRALEAHIGAISPPSYDAHP